jgi:hypothetical protein
MEKFYVILKNYQKHQLIENILKISLVLVLDMWKMYVVIRRLFSKNYFVFIIQESNIARLERKINCGQIEEVIVQVNIIC